MQLSKFTKLFTAKVLITICFSFCFLITVAKPDEGNSPAKHLINKNKLTLAPVINASAAIGTINACLGTASADPALQQFTTNAAGLTADITVTAPTNFEVSLTAASGFGASITVTQVAGTVPVTTIYVRSAASAPTGAIAGNVTLTSAGATNVDVAVTGAITNATVNVVSNQALCVGASTTAVNFTGTAGAYDWINSTPAIGLAASGTGNIASFTATNAGTTPLVGTITVTPSTTTPVTTTQTFNYTGGMQTWTVPAGVTSITIDAVGAGGGTGANGNSSGGPTAGGVGGKGSKASGTLAVTPGQVLNIFVGGAGATPTGGFNGGANGGNVNAGGGGGASDVRVGGVAAANRVIVGAGAGGGGRGGCESANTITGGTGGDGGGNGVNASNAPTAGGVAGGGAGAIGINGGLKGIGCAGFTGVDGLAGTAAGIGGLGGDGQSCCCFSFGSIPAGGGGGGGYLGGGGGGGGTAGTVGCSGNDKGGGGGGAGGSSYTGGVTSGSTTNGIQVGNGLVTITYIASITCTGSTTTYTYTVNPIPTAVSTPAAQTVCSGAPITTKVLSGAVAGTVYNWTRDNTATVTGIGASGAGNISGILVNTTASPVTVTFTITPNYTNAGSTCTGSPITATVVVNPTPTGFTVAGGGTFCPSTQTLTGPVDPNYTYVWQRSLTGIANPNSFTAIGGTTSTQDVTLSGNYRLIVTNQFGCIASDTASVSMADYLFNGSLAIGDATQTGRMNRFGVVSTCAAPKAYPGDFTTTGARLYDSYTITNPRNVPVCATIGIASGCGVNMFSIAYSGSFNPASVSTNYLADPGSSFPNAGYYEATIPANGTIVVVVHEVNVGAGCANYQLVVDVPRDATSISASPGTTSCSGAPITLTAVGTANSYLWSPGGATTQAITASTIGTTNYTVTYGYGNNGCTDSKSQSVTIVNPTVNAITNQVVCNAGTVAVTFSGSDPAATYNWTNTNTNIGILATGSGNLNFTATNTTTAPITATIGVTAVNGACSSAVQTFTITVNPTATVTAVANQAVCNNSPTTAVAFSSPTTGGTIVYNWTNSATSIGLAASGSGNIASFTATNTTNIAITATITVTPSYTNGAVTCVGTARTFTITVSPTPVVSINPAGPVTICNGSNVTLTASSTCNLFAFSGLIAGTQSVPSNASTARGVFNGTFDASTNQISVNIVYNGLASNATAGHIHSGAVGTNGPVIVPFGGFPATTSGTYTNTLALPAAQVANLMAGNTYINIHNATFPGGEIRGQITNVVSGVYTLSGAMAGAQSVPPNASTATGNYAGTYNPATNLLNLNLIFNGLTTNPTVAHIHTGATGTNGGVIIPFGSFPTTSINGSYGNNFTVPAAQIANFLAGNTYINIHSSTFPAGEIRGQISAPTVLCAAPTYLWSTGATTAAITVSTANTYTVATTSGCPSNTASVVVNVNPIPTVNAVTSQVVCNAAATTAVTFSGAVAGTVYNWTNNTTSIGLAAIGSGNIASFTATNTGTAPVVATITVTPSFTNGGTTCTGTPITFTITVNPTATVTAVTNQVVCNNSPTTAVTFSSPTTGGTIVYNWINSTPSIGLAAVGAGNIASFNATNATTAPVTATITVTPSYTNAGVTCVGTPRTFTITVNPTATVLQAGAGGNLFLNGTLTAADPTYNRNVSLLQGGVCTLSGVGTAVKYKTHTFTLTSATNVTISLVPADGAAITPAGADTYLGLYGPGGFVPASACTNAIAANDDAVGALSRIITTTPLAAGTYTVVVTSFDNVPAGAGPLPWTYTLAILIPSTGNTPLTNQVVCNNNPTTAVTFATTATGGTTTYAWTNNTPSIGLAAAGVGNIPSFVGVNATTAPVIASVTVTPTFTNAGVSCVGTPSTYTYTVNPVATVTAVANQVVCNASPTTAVTFTSPTTGGTIVYNWTNSTSSIGLVASGAGNIASFTATNTTNAPVTATINVTPSYTNAGVTCTGTPTTFTITVNPTATVTAVTNQVLCNNSPSTAVTFASPTTGGTIVYNWTNNTTSIGLGASGSGNIASFNATNTTTAPVTATITVTPSYTNGGVTCLGTPSTFTITVNPTPIVNVVANQTLCNGASTAGVNFTSPTTGGTIVYNWTNNTTSIGLGASGSGNISSFVAVNVGTVPVVATISIIASYTNGGVTCTGPTQTFTITVNPTPIVTLAPFAAICKNAAPLTLTGGSPLNGTGGGVGVYFVNGVAQTLFNPANYAPGFHTIVYQFTNSFGCVRSATQQIQVYPIHTVEITLAPNTGVRPGVPVTVIATVSPVDNYTYTWTKNNVLIPSTTTDRITVLGNDAGNYKVTVTAPTGCVVVSDNAFTSSAISSQLFIFPNPNTGLFNVSYNNGDANLTARTLSVYDERGAKVFSKSYSVNVPYGNMVVDIRSKARGQYYVLLIDSNGKKLASATVQKL
jgi:hypothetical protein